MAMIGSLPDGRNLYRAITSSGAVYCATEELITHWDDGTWWSVENENVREWLKQRRLQKKTGE